MTMVQRRIFHPSLAWELDERLTRTVRRIVDLPRTEEQSSWQVGGWWFLAARWNTESLNMETHLGVGYQPLFLCR